MDSEAVVGAMQVVASLAGMLTALAYLGRARSETRAAGAFRGAAPVVVAPLEAGVPAFLVPAVEAALIGVRVDEYGRRFRAFEERGRRRFYASWNWGAFFLGGFWFLFRKVYVPGLALLAAGLGAGLVARLEAGTSAGIVALGAVLALAVLAAITADHAYYRSVTRRARELRQRAGGDEVRAAELARGEGGVDRRVLVLAIVVFVAVVATVILTDDVLYNRSRRWVRRSLRQIDRVFFR